MDHKQFYELYRRLAAARTDAEAARSALGTLLAAFLQTSSNEKLRADWMAGADDCLHAIAESSSLFVAALSVWLVGGDSVALAKAVVHEANVRHLQQPVAEFYALEGVAQVAAVLCAYRLCALGATPAVSLGWTLSLGVSFPYQPAVDKAVIELLNFHVEEFPGTTFRLLSATDSPFAALESAKSVLVDLETEEKWLDEQPRLREFDMTPEMRLALSGLKRGQRRAIERSARENSMLAQIFATQHFKYASKTAVEFHVESGVQETTLEMSRFRLSVELPLSEGTDPISGASRRRALAKGPSE